MKLVHFLNLLRVTLSKVNQLLVKSMRLPRRVPWASLAELDQVCNWIYADENDLDAKILALNRVSAPSQRVDFGWRERRMYD